MLKEKTNKKEKTRYTQSEETLPGKGKKIGGIKHKFNENDTKIPKDSVESSLKTISRKRTL